MKNYNNLTLENDASINVRIYLGTGFFSKRYYVGRTTADMPEEAYLEHRLFRTGPYIGDEAACSWNVLDYISLDDTNRSIEISLLDTSFSYFIGYYDSYENGFNKTRGNDVSSYKNGQADRKRDLADNTHPELKLTTGE